MASIDLIKASDGTGNASVPIVQNTRTAGSSTIVVDTVENINATFMASMGTPHTFVDPITAETITVISEATCVDFSGHVDGANLEIDDIAPGQTDLGSAPDDIIVIRPTTQWGDNVAAVLEVAHNDDGSLIDDLGWTPAGETWTYVSGTGTITGVFKIVGLDKTGKYQAGDKIKFTQTQVKYGIITKVAFSTDTTITVLMSATAGTVDNSGMTNTTISANYFSRVKSPFGFPLDPTRWTITTTSTSQRTTTSTNFTTFTDAITVPIGAWDLGWTGELTCSPASDPASSRYTVVTLSDSALASTTVTYQELTGQVRCKIGATTTSPITGATVSHRMRKTLTSAATFVLYGRASAGSPTTTANLEGSIRSTIITAICAYL